MANRLSIGFDGLDGILKEFEQLANVGLKEATEDALKAAHAVVTPKLQSAIARHRKTGRTEASLWSSPHIEWESAWVAKVNVGFSISGGGLASVFLMYGTPRVAPDRGLYNAIFGSATKRAVQEAQEAAFRAVLDG